MLLLVMKRHSTAGNIELVRDDPKELVLEATLGMGGDFSERTRFIHPPGWVFVVEPGEWGPTCNDNQLLGVDVVLIFHPGTVLVRPIGI